MEDLQALDLLFLAAIAGFLIHRLYSVLGEKQGAEPPKDNIVPLRGNKVDIKVPHQKENEDIPILQKIFKVDPSFDPENFIAGAKGAFEMVVESFAKGDKETLNDLLGPKMFKSFSTAIDQRTKKNETLEQIIDRIKSAKLEDVDIKKDDIFITVRFESTQIIALFDKKGELLEGDPNEAEPHKDLWTFYRNAKSDSPVWQLVATKSVD